MTEYAALMECSTATKESFGHMPSSKMGLRA
jgi:hypothetical protein